MKIVFVIFKYGVPLDDPCCYPLGAAYISSYARHLGHEVKVLNFNLGDYSLHEEFTGQDAVLFTGAIEFLPAIAAAASVARSLGAKTVAGGSAATHRTAEVARFVDSVVVGEGEGALAAALAGAGVFHEPPLPFSQIPRPDYDGIGIEEYHRRHTVRYMGVLASRGCPFRCSFCAHVGPYRERDLVDVFSEIDLYRDRYGVEEIVFNDNTLNVKRARFLEVCREMGDRGLRWSAAIRADRFDAEMARAARDGGCRYFVVGVESFLQDRLDRMHKGVKVEQITRTLDLLHENEIGYHGNLLMGFADESLEEIDRELRAAPRKYNVFPVLFQPFCGVSAKPGIFGRRREEVARAFREYTEGYGMSVYPEVAVC